MATVAVQARSVLPTGLVTKQPIIISDKPVNETDTPEAVDARRYLVTSPYTEDAHLLDLQGVNDESALLALALVKMKSLREDYATAPYRDTFNWDEIIEALRALAREHNCQWSETSFYIVAFRSRIPPTTVYADLGVLDKAAHAEAVASGGLLKQVTPKSEASSLDETANREGQVLVRNPRRRRPESCDMCLEISAGRDKRRCRTCPPEGCGQRQASVFGLANRPPQAGDPRGTPELGHH